MTDKHFKELEFTVFDTETTGLPPAKGARLVEIAAVKVKAGLIMDLKDTFSTLINPKTNIPYNAYSVHGISTTMVAGSPEAHEVLPEFYEFAGDSIVVAHNAKFDCSFIQHHTEEAKMPFPLKRVIDTVKLARVAQKGLKSYSLDNLIHFYGLSVPLPETYRHRALFDAAHTALLLTTCLKKLTDINICTLNQLYSESNKPFYLWK
jgi:DNA polymerase-3 subunit epsilon